MQKSDHPVVSNGLLTYSGNCIPIDSDDWKRWLIDNNKFYYEDQNGHYMAQCEFRRGKPYWYAYRRQNRKLSKVYLGKSDELTHSRLKEAALQLSGTRTEDKISQLRPKNVSDQAYRISPTVLPEVKINGPVPSPHLILRPRLTNQITRPVTVIYAPSGFGKSTLINEWRQECGFPVGWLSLDEQDNHPIRFWNAVILSLRTIAPDFGGKTLIYLNGSSTYHLSETITGLLNELAQTAANLPGLGLVIDDVHYITNSEILDTLQLTIDRLPPKVQIIFAGRSRLPLAFGHLRSKCLITELESNDLRFTQEEADHYIKQFNLQLNLAAEDITRLAKHTEGWAAGLTLSVLAMNRQENPRKFLETFSGAHIYMREYFLETVLQRVPSDIQYFLIRTAILKHLNGSLCDAITGWDNGEQILTYLWQNNIFIEKLEQQGWYRYHDLFSEMLFSQLLATAPEEIGKLHRRAAQWYRDHYALADAVNHLLAIQAWEEASALIEEMALRELEQNGEDSRLLRWLETLPESVVQKHKTLLFVYLSLACSALSRNRIEQFISNIEANLIHVPYSSLSPAEVDVLEEIRQFWRVWKRGKEMLPSPVTITQAEDRWAIYRDFQNLYFAYDSYSSEMAQNLPVLLDKARKTRNLFMIVMSGGAYSHSLYLEGQLRHAERVARQVLDDAKNLRGTLPEPASISLVTLALVHLMRYDIDLSMKYLDQAGEVDPNPTSTNMSILLAISRAKIFSLKDNFDEAFNSLLIAQELQLRHPSRTWTEQDLIAYQARILMRKGDWFGAQDTLDRTIQSAKHPLSQLIQAEILITTKQYAGAEEILQQLLSIYVHGIHYEPLFDARIMLAISQFLQRKIHQACQTIVDFIRKAAQEKIILPFIEAGPQIVPLLQVVLATENLNREAKGFLKQIIAMLPGYDVTSAMDELTLLELKTAASISPRQQEILRLTSEGLSVKEMAEKLCISDSTVKTHLTNIYQNLNARSRTQAINRARDLGLINPES
ncbi:MAG TPA: LuxR C-terminal-related transcriptional regulator [Anaerolineaceae bacterium]